MSFGRCCAGWRSSLSSDDGYPYAGEGDEYEYYVIRDGLGISHFLRQKKGVHPSIKCDNCE